MVSNPGDHTSPRPGVVRPLQNGLVLHGWHKRRWSDDHIRYLGSHPPSRKNRSFLIPYCLPKSTLKVDFVSLDFFEKSLASFFQGASWEKLQGCKAFCRKAFFRKRGSFQMLRIPLRAIKFRGSTLNIWTATIIYDHWEPSNSSRVKKKFLSPSLSCVVTKNPGNCHLSCWLRVEESAQVRPWKLTNDNGNFQPWMKMYLLLKNCYFPLPCYSSFRGGNSVVCVFDPRKLEDINRKRRNTSRDSGGVGGANPWPVICWFCHMCQYNFLPDRYIELGSHRILGE